MKHAPHAQKLKQRLQALNPYLQSIKARENWPKLKEEISYWSNDLFAGCLKAAKTWHNQDLRAGAVRNMPKAKRQKTVTLN